MVHLLPFRPLKTPMFCHWTLHRRKPSCRRRIKYGVLRSPVPRMLAKIINTIEYYVSVCTPYSRVHVSTRQFLSLHSLDLLSESRSDNRVLYSARCDEFHHPFSFSSVDELRSQCLLQTLSLYVFGLAARQLIPSLKTDQSSIGQALSFRNSPYFGPRLLWTRNAHRLNEKHPRRTLQIKFKFDRIIEL